MRVILGWHQGQGGEGWHWGGTGITLVTGRAEGVAEAEVTLGVTREPRWAESDTRARVAMGWL